MSFFEIVKPMDLPSNFSKDYYRPSHIHIDSSHYAPNNTKCLQKLSQINHSEQFDFEKIKNEKSISVDALAYLIRFHPIHHLILDCRSFLKYNASHIRDAINVSCSNGTMRKRISNRKWNISEIVMGGPDAKDRLRAAEEIGALFVVYDDGIYDPSNKKSVDSINTLSTKLISDSRNLCSLKGGIDAFLNQYEFLCESSLQTEKKSVLYSPTSPYNDAAIDTTEASQILPYLYLGNERDAGDEKILLSLGITHILNITHSIPLLKQVGSTLLTSLRIPANDLSNQNLKQYFQEAIDFIELARESNGRVLLHCQAGVSRSPSIMMAYLMSTRRMTMMQTFEFVKTRRSIISPNLNFLGQLLEFQESLQIS